MNDKELKEILQKHAAWLNHIEGGVRANLSRTCLSGANLSYSYLKRANMSHASLSGVDLHGADLRGADLSEADLRGADLSEADLRGADLRHSYLNRANLSHANLTDANLTGADLTGADLDFSSWPLWCGSLDVKIDVRLAAQLLYHATRVMQSCSEEPDVAAVLSSPEVLRLANRFHRVNECGQIQVTKEGGAK